MKTKYIVLSIIALILVGGAIAETFKDIIVSKTTYDALTVSATKDGITPEQKASSLIEKAITDQATIDQQKANDKLELELNKYRAKCKEMGIMQKCIDALKTATQ